MDPQLLRSAATVADYGYDAPYALVIFAVIGAAGAIGAIVAWREGDRHLTAVMSLYAVLFLGNALSFFYTTRRGKFVVWNNILDRLHVRGDEHVLDMGCGRGAVLIAVARRLTSGRVIGIDLWSTRDQSGNASHVTRRNASLEGVLDRVDIETGDMRARCPLPTAPSISSSRVSPSTTFVGTPTAPGRSRKLGACSGLAGGS